MTAGQQQCIFWSIGSSSRPKTNRMKPVLMDFSGQPFSVSGGCLRVARGMSPDHSAAPSFSEMSLSGGRRRISRGDSPLHSLSPSDPPCASRFSLRSSESDPDDADLADGADWPAAERKEPSAADCALEDEVAAAALLALHAAGRFLVLKSAASSAPCCRRQHSMCIIPALPGKEECSFPRSVAVIDYP